MKKLLVFTSGKLEEMLAKGNVWYVRHFEAYFDEVYFLYLYGNGPQTVKQGNTTLISLATGKGKWDLLFAPYRVLRFAQKIKPTIYLSADILCAWWFATLIKIILKAKFTLVPVSIPEDVYRISGETFSGLPKCIDRFLIKLSFLSADKVLTGRNNGSYVDWLSAYKYSKHKLIVVNKTIDHLPTFGFLKKLKENKKSVSLKQRDHVSLLYVGRLHKQKAVDDLIIMLARLLELRPNVRFILTLIGDGPEREHLLTLARNLKVEKIVKFFGYLKNEELVDYYLNSDIFLSPLTGTSLKEAGLCGLPVIAYDIDWVKKDLKHGENALLVPPRDTEAMAKEIITLIEDDDLKLKLSKNIKSLAWEMWGDTDIRESLTAAFDENNSL